MSHTGTGKHQEPLKPKGNSRHIAIIGAGPRGTSILERINARLTQHSSKQALTIHIIEKSQPGAGAIWRTNQHRELCMNTLAAAVTLFTDSSCQITGPIRPGPNLYQWAKLALTRVSPKTTVTNFTVAQNIAKVFEQQKPQPSIAKYAAEITQMRPESHPSRALYGEYIRWCYNLAIAKLAQKATIVQHSAQVLSVTERGDSDELTLDNGDKITADATVYAAGWLPRQKTQAEEQLSGQIKASAQKLVWVPPASPADQDLSEIKPRKPVIVRGMGMGFFDTMALLTIGRGGEFVAGNAIPHGLRYRPSGAEPVIYVTSHRGVPYRAKTRYHALPPRAPQKLLREFAQSQAPRPIDFNRQLWPRIIGDACRDFITTYAQTHPANALTASVTVIHTAINDAVQKVVNNTATSATKDLQGHALLRQTTAEITAATMRFVANAEHRFNLTAELNPAAGLEFSNPESFQEWVVARVASDIAEANKGLESAIKAMLWSISAARAVANGIGTMGAFTAESRATGHALLASLGSMLGSGPPAFRSEQLLALADARLVKFIGPASSVTVTQTGFVAESPVVHGSKITATALIDAWMHPHSVAQSADPLTQSLVTAKRARPFTVRANDGTEVATTGFDIEAATGRLRGERGADQRFHIAGIPLDATRHETIISPMPGANPPMLRETDAVAQSLLAVAFAAAEFADGTA
ncbi:FAD/NAD(P)-binding protein [Canibacter sp. lx-45]|uniref:FAD/NAD(P)-binding protein n=1 Tax=Canibacter zhuwentaonis TaxID=2837491 RepID=UPI001BDC752C|nr:FAD/NAD(P)-binding protein [Canibacter zhuwentaonis]MBT1035360.1 FAD/NAD(P)-binding protein [Canibacter zhuwentaonis]